MNGAIALAWCGEVLVELGYGQEASRLAAEARHRTAKADIDDAMLDAILSMVEAQSARLVGDVAAPERLAAVDITLSPDLGVLVTREHARRAWDEGDLDGAAALYDQAAEASERSGYKSLARLISVERGSGPPIPKTDPAPFEPWAERSFQQRWAGHRPYAIVFRLVLDEDADRFSGLEQDIEAMLNRDPALGSVDGTGSDGEVWELFLDGDDPDALWAAIRPLEAVGPPPGSLVEMRKGNETLTLPLR
jgi:hypothetical protein